MVREQPPETEWIANDLVVRGCVTMLHGAAGIGKSMLSLAVATGVAIGEPVAGMDCLRGPVIYIDGENGLHEIHRRVHTLGVPPEGLVMVEAVGFDLRKHLDRLEALIAEHAPLMIVLDAWRALWRGDENDPEAVAAVLEPLRQIAHDHNIGILLDHHVRRSDHDYRGSSAVDHTVELRFSLERTKDDDDSTRRYLACRKCRPAPEPATRWLRLSAELGMVLVDAAEPPEKDEPVGAVGRIGHELAPQILSALRRPLPLREVAEAVGRDAKDRTVRRVLEGLEREGLVEPTGPEHRRTGWCRTEDLALESEVSSVKCQDTRGDDTLTLDTSASAGDSEQLFEAPPIKGCAAHLDEPKPGCRYCRAEVDR